MSIQKGVTYFYLFTYNTCTGQTDGQKWYNNIALCIPAHAGIQYKINTSWLHWY